MRHTRPRYIGWIDSTSVATGQTIAEVTDGIFRILTSDLWRAQNEGRLHTCKVTTYGTQRTIFVYQASSGAPTHPGMGA